MKRLITQTDISYKLYADSSVDWKAVLMPPVHWYARGPRGGIYEGTGPREMVAADADPEAFLRNIVRVYVKSEGARYLRPRSKAWQVASEALR